VQALIPIRASQRHAQLMTWSGKTAPALAAAGGVFLAVATLLTLLAPGTLHDVGPVDTAENWASWLVMAVLGVRVLRRWPGHRIGWVMVISSAVLGFTTFAQEYAFIGMVTRGYRLPAPQVADVASNGSWVLMFATLTALAFLFPDGRMLDGRRWRDIGVAATVAFTGAWLGATLKPGLQNAPFDHVRNPVGAPWLGGPGQLLVGVFMLSMLASIVAAAVSVMVRFRRSNGIERLQLTWFAYAAVLVPATLAACFIGLLFTGTDAIGAVAATGISVIVPLAVGVAVLRYRLYDIGRLVNRTLVYATVTLLLVGGYASTSLLVGVVLGRGTSVGTAASTLVAALAFRPLRSRVQSAVDRRFDRDRYQGLRVIDRFLENVRSGGDAPERVGAVLAEALRDPTLELALWLPERGGFVDPAGHDLAGPAADDTRVVRSVTRGGQLLAELRHNPRLMENPHLLDGVLTQATLGIEVARLRAEVAHHLSEVQQSRARIVEAGFEERRRLERDLHDGAQQRLVTLGVALRRMQRSLPGEARVLGPALDGAVDEIGAAISDLRRIAAGVRPARLDDGLAAALRDLARTSPVPVDVVATDVRVPAPIEEAAYFVVCEALTNAVKHSTAGSIRVQAVRRDDRLHVTVWDDGVGGAQARPGTGLAGLADRVAAHGGRLLVNSPHGQGTRVEAVLPCGS
jgi:signal transduction histidine kinase